MLPNIWHTHYCSPPHSAVRLHLTILLTLSSFRSVLTGPCILSHVFFLWLFFSVPRFSGSFFSLFHSLLCFLCSLFSLLLVFFFTLGLLSSRSCFRLSFASSSSLFFFAFSSKAKDCSLVNTLAPQWFFDVFFDETVPPGCYRKSDIAKKAFLVFSRLFERIHMAEAY